ncbi:alginate O-acetyltransferase AlgX-related protein [Sunxiuqinia sp. A32]|uniref:alginate O-acetyltransferase AlgX-related protein n=1 Tax=Sunxiuqinia sp. A32 TaxID=3461496 RepID=UPI0040452F8A
MIKRHQYILVVSFSIFLIIPHLFEQLDIFQGNINSENRKTAEKPEFDLAHLDNYPKQYDSYFNDHFGLRPLGLEAYNNFSYFFLKKSPAPKKAILGKDGWLFQGKDMEHYRGSVRLTESELKKLELEFIKRDNYLKQQNCKFIFIIVPTKKEIYPEYLPDEYFRYSQYTMTDQLLKMLKTKTNVDVIDLRPIIKNAKKSHPILYHKMDNHWNDIASLYAYKAIINHLNIIGIDAGTPHSYSDFKIDTTTYYGGSIAKMLGVQDIMIDYRLKLIPNFENTTVRLPQKYQSPERFPYPGSYERRHENPNDSAPRLMMINDSFGEYLYPLLSEHFSYSIFLFDGWEFKLHAKKVIDEKPDIFLMATFEGFIPNILNNIYRDENNIPE